MMAKLEEPSPVCLICLEPSSFSRSQGRFQRDLKLQQQQEEEDGEAEDEHGVLLVSRFLTFSRHYLNVPVELGTSFQNLIITSTINNNTNNSASDSGGASERRDGERRRRSIRPFFCEECTASLSVLLGEYDRLKRSEARLLWRMSQLTELLMATTTVTEEDLLRVEEIEILKKFRDEVRTRCRNKASKISPTVSIRRKEVEGRTSELETFPPPPPAAKTSAAQNRSNTGNGQICLTEGEVVEVEATAVIMRSEDGASETEEEDYDDGLDDDDHATSNDEEQVQEGPREKKSGQRGQQLPRRRGWKGTDVQCLHCYQIFPSKKRLQAHAREAGHSQRKRGRANFRLSNPQSLSCQLCHLKFPKNNPIGLYNHLATAHDKKRLLDCAICGKRLPDGMRLQKHLFEEHEKPEKDLYCSYCSNRFSTSQLRDLHARFSHLEDIYGDGDDSNGTTSNSNEGLDKKQGGSRGQMWRDKEAQCLTCYRILSSKPSLSQHVRQTGHFQRLGQPPGATNTPQALTCSSCQLSFQTPVGLYNHLGWDHPDKGDLLQCAICEERLPDVLRLRQHLFEQHEKPQEKSVCCRYCSDLFTTSQLADLHSRFSHLDKPPAYFCEGFDECPLEFFSASELNSHLQNDHQEGAADPLFICEKCGWGFNSEAARTLHAFNHVIPAEDGYFDCPEAECFRRLGTQTSLKMHYNFKHIAAADDKVEVFPCSKCWELHKTRWYGFSRKELEWHEKSHAYGSVKNVVKKKCKHCSGFAGGSGALLKHMRDEHPDVPSADEMARIKRNKRCSGGGAGGGGGTKRAKTNNGKTKRKCLYCPSTFGTAWELREHQKAEHSDRLGIGVAWSLGQGKGPFICEQCGFTARIRSRLEEHKLTHSSAKPSVCDQCGVPFKSKAHLQKHVEAVHSKPYSCPTCSKLFAVRQMVAVHMRAEHDGFRIPCHYCRSSSSTKTKTKVKEFKLIRNKMDHVRLKHGAAQFQEYCQSELKAEKRAMAEYYEGVLGQIKRIQ